MPRVVISACSSVLSDILVRSGTPFFNERCKKISCLQVVLDDQATCDFPEGNKTETFDAAVGLHVPWEGE